MPHPDEEQSEELNGLCMAFAVLTLLMQAVWLFATLRFLWRGGMTACRSFALLLFRKRFDCSSNPEVREQVSKLLSARQVKLARLVILAAWSTACILAAFVVTHVLRGHEEEPSNMILQSLMVLWVSIIALFPKTFTNERALPLSHTMTIVLLSSLSFSPADEDRRTYRAALIAVMSVFLSGSCLRFNVLALSHSLLFACSIVSHIVFVHTHPDSKWNLESIITIELFIWVLKLPLFYCAESAMRFSILKEVEARLGKCQQSAVSSLLDMLCEAVVDLDQDFLLKEHFTKLAAMLMHGSGKSLRGETLGAFLAEDEDKYRFEAILQRSQHQANKQPAQVADDKTISTEATEGPQGPPLNLSSFNNDTFSSDSVSISGAGSASPMLPSMLPCTLRDSIGQRLKVVLFHMPYVSIGGRTHHLIGIREDSVEETWDGGTCEAQPRSLPEAVLRPDLARRLCITHPSLNVVDQFATERLGGCLRRTPSALSTEERPEKRMSMELYLAPSLPIRSAAPDLCEHLGLPPQPKGGQLHFGDSLLDGGKALLEVIVEITTEKSQQRDSGQFAGCLGVLEINRHRGGLQEKIRRRVWLKFFLPLREDAVGGRYVAIALGRSAPGGIGQGTAPGGSPMSLQSMPHMALAMAAAGSGGGCGCGGCGGCEPEHLFAAL